MIKFTELEGCEIKLLAALPPFPVDYLEIGEEDEELIIEIGGTFPINSNDTLNFTSTIEWGD